MGSMISASRKCFQFGHRASFGRLKGAATLGFDMFAIFRNSHGKLEASSQLWSFNQIFKFSNFCENLTKFQESYYYRELRQRLLEDGEFFSGFLICSRPLFFLIVWRWLHIAWPSYPLNAASSITRLRASVCASNSSLNVIGAFQSCEFLRNRHLHSGLRSVTEFLIYS